MRFQHNSQRQKFPNSPTLTRVAISSTARNWINASTSDIGTNFVLKNTHKCVGAWSWDAKIIVSKTNSVGITDTWWNVTIVGSVSLITNKSKLAIAIKITVCWPTTIKNTLDLPKHKTSNKESTSESWRREKWCQAISVAGQWRTSFTLMCSLSLLVNRLWFW